VHFLKQTTSVFVVVFLFGVSGVLAQQSSPRPSPSPARTPTDTDQEAVKVFTEEVRLPVTALDAYGHYDPTLQIDDVLVLEDGVAQQVRSVRHLPAHVLLLLDTGGETSGVGVMSKSTSLTRQVATNLVNRLQAGSWIAVMQSSSSAELLQSWTTDKQAVLKVLKTKLSQSKRSRISETVAAAAQELQNRPEGARHVIMITDYVDSPGGKIDRSEAVRRLLGARATVHVISYTEFVRQKSPNKTTDVKGGMRPVSGDPISSTDPTMPPGQTRSPTFGVDVRFDPAMRRKRKAYEADVIRSQQELKSIAEETGGKISLPINADQMLAESNDIARAIAAEYVVTYRPKRPLAEAPAGEYRKVEVASRRVGIYLHARKGYVVPSSQN
jgi:VWFA-related protein